MKHLNKILIEQRAAFRMPVAALEEHTPNCPEFAGDAAVVSPVTAVAQEAGMVAQTVDSATTTVSTEVTNDKASGEYSLGYADNIAQEGLVDSIKAGWDKFKQAVKPSDHSAIIAKIKFLGTVKKGIFELKTKVSQMKDEDFKSGHLKHALRGLPVSADTPEQLIAGMEQYRKRIAALSQQALTAKDEKELAKIRQMLAMELSKKGEISPNLTFTRSTAIKFCDAMVNFITTLEVMGREYMQAHEKAKAAGESIAQEALYAAIALEGLDCLDIAMESAGGVIWGSLMLYVAIFLRLVAYVGLFASVGALLTGNVPGFLGGMIVSAVLFDVTDKMIGHSNDLIFETEPHQDKQKQEKYYR